MAFSAADLMVTSPGSSGSTAGTLAIGASPGGAATTPATAQRGGGGGAAPGLAAPIVIGLVDGTGRPGALAAVAARMPAALAAPEVIPGLAGWPQCANSFLGAAPAAVAAATWLAAEVPSLQRVPLIRLPLSLPKVMTTRPVLVVCKDLAS